MFPFHISTTHNEADCRAQGKPRQQTSKQYTATAVPSATSPPDGIREDSDFDCGFMWMASTAGETATSQATYSPLSRLPSVWSRFTERTTWSTSEKAYRLVAALLSGAAQRPRVVHRNNLQAVKVITMLVDSDPTENFVDNELIPEAESLMLDYAVFEKPKKIATAG